VSSAAATSTCQKEPINIPSDRKIFFRSFKLGKLILKNRFVMAPMTRAFSPGGIPTQQVAAYYRRRALGGVGLIITEGTFIAHPSSRGYGKVPELAGAQQLAGWRKVVDAVHAAGGRIFPQLWHTGSYCRPDFDRGGCIERLAPSAVAHPGFLDYRDQHLPKRMSAADIEQIIASYAAAAAAAMAAGFDGVEIHGAHGYLIDQFFWELTNKRLDQYGGNLRDRARFACLVVRAVRSATSPDFPICFRFSNWKLNAYDSRGVIFHDPRELQTLLALLSEAGVDIFHASSRRFHDPAFAGSPLSLAGWTVRLCGKPTITVGSVGLTTDFIAERQGALPAQCSLDRLIALIQEENFDLVAIGRALLADPEWVNKIASRQDERIIPYDRRCLTRLY
jgi:2,4-dienoyl-CoA reductase-like NADH-dependent reductase (Old Yellow Enzyme family)